MKTIDELAKELNESLLNPKEPEQPTLPEEPLHNEHVKAWVHHIGEEIYLRYKTSYQSDNLQGCCLVIADDIRQETGGIATAGMLTWYGGSCSRSHWWIEKDGEFIDPMGDRLLEYEQHTGRIIEHQNQDTFDSLLPYYEKYRVL